MLVLRLLATAVVVFVILAPGARAAVTADAQPDAAAPYQVAFESSRADVVSAVTVSGLAPGALVELSCRGCLGTLPAQATASGANHVFRVTLRVPRSARVVVSVLGRNFGRTREYRVKAGRLRSAGTTCTSVAEGRPVGCVDTDAEGPWATMNVCTPKQVGIRAATPGGGRAGETVAAQFRLQFQDGTRWLEVPSGTSRWTYLGPANRAFQGGYTFNFGGLRSRTFRGVVDFEWRRGKSVVKRATRFTSPGRSVASGASSSVCVLP